MNFVKFNELLQRHFQEMCVDTSTLFEVDADKDALWNLYLDSFPPGTNEIFRTRREFDCSCCRSFIRQFGNVVVIKNNALETIWDFETNDSTYQPVIEALSSYIKSRLVGGIHVCKLNKVGTVENKELDEFGKVITWNHLNVVVPDRFIDKTSRSEGDIQGQLRDTKNVFKRSLDEITQDSVETVMELIGQNSLYKGEEWNAVLQEFLKLKKEYTKISESKQQELYAWEKSVSVGAVIGRIRNHSIGVLLTDISEGIDLEKAVKKYEDIVAPSNYKRPKAIFTKKMLDDAKKTIEELGYLDSLPRRFATLEDITVNNILFSNRDVAKRIGGFDVFEDMQNEVSIDPKKFSKVEEITIENFISNVLPTAKDVSVFLENKHDGNMVSLIAPVHKEASSMFKWGNCFSWAYSGNMTDCLMKERVKAAGGKVDGVLRFSIQWNDTPDEYDKNDLDAHCTEPNGHIYFGHMRNIYSGGHLDVDNTHPDHGTPAVENITWGSTSTMKDGIYAFSVHNFSHRGGRNGFRAEIEFEGKIYSYDYRKELKNKESVDVAKVTFSKKNGFSISECLPSSTSSRQIWNLHTNQFVPVSTIMLSPNYWDGQDGGGHRHYFFMLKDCVNSERPNAFYNEFLKEDLMKHKRVFEALGGKMAVETVDDQLSGVGFSSTKRAELLVKVKGATERVLKIKF